MKQRIFIHAQVRGCPYRYLPKASDVYHDNWCRFTFVREKEYGFRFTIKHN